MVTIHIPIAPFCHAKYDGFSEISRESGTRLFLRRLGLEFDIGIIPIAKVYALFKSKSEKLKMIVNDDYEQILQRIFIE